MVKKSQKFIEVIDITPNHTFVIGTIGRGKQLPIFDKLQQEEKSTVPKPLFGDRVIPIDEVLNK